MRGRRGGARAVAYVRRSTQLAIAALPSPARRVFYVDAGALRQAGILDCWPDPRPPKTPITASLSTISASTIAPISTPSPRPSSTKAPISRVRGRFQWKRLDAYAKHAGRRVPRFRLHHAGQLPRPARFRFSRSSATSSRLPLPADPRRHPHHAGSAQALNRPRRPSLGLDHGLLLIGELPARCPLARPSLADRPHRGSREGHSRPRTAAVKTPSAPMRSIASQSDDASAIMRDLSSAMDALNTLDSGAPRRPSSAAQPDWLDCSAAGLFRPRVLESPASGRSTALPQRTFLSGGGF